VRLLVGEREPAIADDHLLAGRHEVDAIGLDRHALLDEDHRHVGVARDQLGHQAAEVRRQVLHDDERHAGRLRERREQLLERLEPAGRRADADDSRVGAIVARGHGRCGVVCVHVAAPG